MDDEARPEIPPLLSAAEFEALVAPTLEPAQPGGRSNHDGHKKSNDSKRKEARAAGNDLVTEDGAACQFAALYGGKLRYCHDTGGWFEWNGHIWKRNQTGLAFHWSRELARRLSDSEDDRVRVAASKASFAGAVERFARSDPVFAVESGYWDKDHFLLGTPSGTVDLAHRIHDGRWLASPLGAG
jgi:hypothetical protein